MPDDRVVEIAPRAYENLQALSEDVAVRISTKLRSLARDPRPRGDTIKRLSGFDTPTFRLRIGDYRAIFRVRARLVRVLRIVHRSQLERAIRDLE